MKWVNHTAIACATVAIIDPYLIPVTALGATAPDWLETLANTILRQNFSHRRQTHYATTWIGLIIFFIVVFDYNNFGLAFAYGGLTHVLTDSLTISGVPFSPWSSANFHLFGGRLKTGEMGEFIVSGVVILLCATIYINIGSINDRSKNTKSETGYIPFFFDYRKKYNDGIIDAIEWKRNRFKFF